MGLNITRDPETVLQNEPNRDDEPGSNIRQIVAAILLLAGLVAVGLWLTGTLRSAAQIQDCVAGGRTNCAPVGR